jgi:hypothetical protein
MGINMDKMRERMETLKGNGNARKNSFWKPEEGEQTIRLVAPDNGDPFRDFWFHYDVAGEPGFLSPKRNFGEDCPLDDYVRALWKEGSEESKRMARKLGAKQRFFAPVVVRGRENEGVKVWGFGKRAYETLLGLVLNPEYGDITDPSEGTDLVITYSKPAGASYPETKITPRRRASQLTEDNKEAVQLLESVPDFDEVFSESRRSSTQVTDILNRFLNTVDEGTSAIVEKTNASGTDVDKAFAELLGS